MYFYKKMVSFTQLNPHPNNPAMKKPASIIAILAALALLCAASPSKNSGSIPEAVQNHPERGTFTALDKNSKPTPLYNGRDLEGWYTFHHTYGKNDDRENSIKSENGMLHFCGQDMGYLCTEKSFGNYYFKAVFRWGEKKFPPRLDRARDSGILYHLQDTIPDKVWPPSIECQIQENDCGDYWCVGGTNADSPNETIIMGKQKRIVRTANYENPGQEWNTIEVICLDDRSWHYVNGHLVNQATNLSFSEGRILLQLEAAEIFYKTVEILPLK